MSKTRVSGSWKSTRENCKPIRGLFRRAVALTLCAAMVVSMIAVILPPRAGAAAVGVNDRFSSLYIREADANTMDSYVQASLGGYSYNKDDFKVDGTTGATLKGKGPWVINNFGTRYAGEVWADLSVFALGQKVAGTYNGDGGFNGKTLTLKTFTDGLDSFVDIMDYSDFLNVFSVLGSSQANLDEEPVPLDVIFVLDTSASMSSAGEAKRYHTEGQFDPSTTTAPDNKNVRLEFAADALNNAFEILMNNGSKYNRVGLITYDETARIIMDLGRYEPTVVDRSETYKDAEGNDLIGEDGKKQYVYSQGYRNGETRYFTIAQASLVEAAKTVKSVSQTHVTDNETLAQAGNRVQGSKEPWGDYFTIIWGQAADGMAASEVAARSDTGWDGGYVGNRRIAFRQKQDPDTKQGSIMFTTSGPATVKVWWWAGAPSGTPNNALVGDSHVQILDKDGKLVDSTENHDNPPYPSAAKMLSTLNIPEAGTYYLGNSDVYNFFYKVEVTQSVKEIYNNTATPEQAKEPPIIYRDPFTRDERYEDDGRIIDSIAKYNGDPRFPQALRTINEKTVLADGQGYAEDWKVVEINARPETVDHAGEKRTLYAGEVHSQAEENGQDTSENPLNYFYTRSYTNTPDALTLALRTLYVDKANTEDGYDDYKVKLYRADNGTLTDEVQYTTNEKGEKVEKEPEVILPRRPIIILISDGAPNPSTLNEEWWRTTGSSRSKPPEEGVPVITAATGTYGKKKVNRAYYGDKNFTGREWGKDWLEAEIYTLGFMLADPDKGGYINDGQNARSTLDPGGLFDGRYTGGNYDETLKHMRGYLEGYETKDPYNMGNNYNMQHPQDSINYDLKEEKDFIYTNGYTEVNDPSKLPDVFGALVRSVLNQAFTPVEGANATGVDNAVTYSNPIGDYMTVDGVTAVTMFGEHYTVGRYAVYDYHANAAILVKQGKQSTDFIKEGWYDSDYNYYGKNGGDNGGLAFPDGVTAGNAWEKGYTYRITYLRAQELIPTLATTNSNTELTEKQMETTFTIYRINGQKGKENIDGVHRTVDSVPKDITITEDSDRKRHNFSYDLNFFTDTVSGYHGEARFDVTFDLWDDIHIWVEDTGDWRDSTLSNFIVDNTYSQALYINIDNNALPMQVAAVVMQTTTTGRNPDVPLKYVTNLRNYWASTPLRLYYSVSLDSDYLRFLESDNKAHDKQNATGVALSKVSSEYLDKNRTYYKKAEEEDGGDGHYDEVEAGVENAGQYVAFYANYFTNRIYTGYATLSDAHKQSRGNSIVSFSPGDENQFYRFQKNRVLYLIPGTYGLNSRPAEIDFGDLSGASGVRYYVEYTGSGENKEYTGRIKAAKEGSDGPDPDSGNIWEYLDPTDYQHLMILLNAYRANLDWNRTAGTTISNDGTDINGNDAKGKKATYWYFGDCMPVDDGKIDSAMHTEMLDKRDPDRSNTRKLIDDQQACLERDDYANKDEDGTITGYTIPKISAENWYYIIREFYYPTDFNEKGDPQKIEIRYMAIPRKGAELGTGVGGGSQEFVQWYQPSTDAEDDSFDSTAKDKDYNKPKDKGEGWYIAAKPGGLRTGSLANFAGVKGYSIREGVSDGSFTERGEKIDGANVTETAKTYFLPTIGDSSTMTTMAAADTPVTYGASKVVVNVYLGNNGRILVPDTVLLVTKTVNTGDPNATGTTAIPSGELEKFTFIVKIKGFSGVRGAVVVTRDEFDHSQWRRRFQDIDVLTDNRNLLMADDNDLAVVDADGRRVVRAEVINEDGTTTEIGWYHYSDTEQKENPVTGTMHYVLKDKGEVEDEDESEIEGVDEGVDEGESEIEGEGEGKDKDEVTKYEGKLYYVYVGKNVTEDYGDDILRVFDADPGGDLYNNAAARGGRTFYAATDEIAKSLAAQHTDEDGTPHNLLTVFAVAKDGKHAAGDREYWIDKVCLIPMESMTSDWRWELDATLKEVTKETVLPPGYILIDGTPKQKENSSDPSDETPDDPSGETPETTTVWEPSEKHFVVAILRAADKTGNTSDTALDSDDGFDLRSNFMTIPVEFTMDDKGYGTTTKPIKLADGEGLLFNNIDNGAWYEVTEILSRDQINSDIQFQQVDHVQGAKLRTRYFYDSSSPLSPNNGVTLKEVVEGITGPLLKNVNIERSYEAVPKGSGNGPVSSDPPPGPNDGEEYRYYWWDGQRYDDDGKVEAAANFTQENRYTVVGQTSAYESAVHYVNNVPGIKKLEFFPGAGEKVRVGETITYGIRWENFEYDTTTGSATSATVKIRDRLDDGVEFVSAVFNPYHGNMYDTEGSEVPENPGDSEDPENPEVPEDPEDSEKREASNKQIQFDADEFIGKFEEWIEDENSPYWMGSEKNNVILRADSDSGEDATERKPIYAFGRVGQTENEDGSGLDTRTPEKEVDTSTPTIVTPPEGSAAATSTVSENEVDTPVPVDITIKYDKGTHTVTWWIMNAPPSTYGYVVLTVRTTEKALKEWDYDDNNAADPLQPKNDIDSTKDDHVVHNRAGVTVGNHAEVFTEKITNPLVVITMPGAGGPGVVALLWTGSLLLIFGAGLAFLCLQKRRRAGPGTVNYHQFRDTGPPGPPGLRGRRGR